jgi:hypothetical protein
VLDDDRDLLVRSQLCEHGGEDQGSRGRAPVDGVDRVAGANPCLRGGPAGRDRADEDAVPVRVAHSDAEEGAMRIDDLAVGDDLSGDVDDEIVTIA